MLGTLKEKITANKKDILLITFAFLAILASFALGYLTARDYSVAPIIIQKCSSDPIR